MIQKRRQEERSRRVDEAIRRHQQSRREAAATLEQKAKTDEKQNGAIGTMGKSDRKRDACEGVLLIHAEIRLIFAAR